MSIKIEFSNKTFYTLIVFIAVAAASVFVYANSNPAVFHSAEEVGIDFETGRIANNGIIDVIPGYSKSDCHLMVSAEDWHLGTSWTGDYRSEFGDSGQWRDNHYAGAQAYYTSHTSDSWKALCRFGFRQCESSYDDDSCDPKWRNANCRYLVICEK